MTASFGIMRNMEKQNAEHGVQLRRLRRMSDIHSSSVLAGKGSGVSVALSLALKGIMRDGRSSDAWLRGCR